MVIRGISDLINNKAKVDKAGYQEIAARHASAFAFEILAKLQLNEKLSTINNLDSSTVNAQVEQKIDSIKNTEMAGVDMSNAQSARLTVKQEAPNSRRGKNHWS